MVENGLGLPRPLVLYRPAGLVSEGCSQPLMVFTRSEGTNAVSRLDDNSKRRFQRVRKSTSVVGE
jgi:hypothetical protein